jgi:PTS system fructose-specific IIC component
MAAESLEQSARAAGHDIVVETQGAIAWEPLSPETIAAADAVIIAADVQIRDRERFTGKPVVTVGVRRAITDAPGLLDQAVAAAGAASAAVAGGGSSRAGGAGTAMAGTDPVTAGVEAMTGTVGPATGAGPEPWGTHLRRWLMTGVGHMVPFVSAGGILIALSFLVAQVSAGRHGPVLVARSTLAGVASDFDATSGMAWAALLYVIGAAAFVLLVPVLAGYIAFGIAGRPGLAPGFVGGAIAAALGTGFIGGIAAGLIGGLLAVWVGRWALPRGARAVLPVVVIPLISTLGTGAALLIVLGRPLRALTTGLSSWLDALSGVNLVVLGVVLGLMMGFDLGGPVNKVAYAFATTGLASTARGADTTNLKIMAAVMAAGMTPPLGMALASTVRGRLFSAPERANGRAAWLLGASFISEGAIPFAVADPWRVISSSMVGSAVAGGLVMVFGNTSRAPHGGIWVAPLIGSPLLFLLAVAVGAGVTAALVIGLKSTRRAVAAEEALAGAAG